jgi:uncharacterized SAM-binding protein YcdF (DUF218 family)
VEWRKKRLFCLTACALVLLLVSIIPVRLLIATVQSPQPQAILMLGGSMEREIFTAHFAIAYPTLNIWVSSSTSVYQARSIFNAIGISNSRLQFDNRAVDTVTNFTSLVADFQQMGIRHIYLITSSYHMGRAKAIAFFVFGSAGIAFTPVSAPSAEPSESPLRILRDILRAIVWIFTGFTGASLTVNS